MNRQRLDLVIAVFFSACAPVAAPSAVTLRAAPAPLGQPSTAPAAAIPAEQPRAAVEPMPAAAVAAPARSFPPADITPPSARSAAATDGQWRPLGEPTSAGSPARLYTTVIHPHESSRFISLTLVAIDLTRVRLELVPGVDDIGKMAVPFAPGLVPEPDQASLVAAFNGGFMPQHGRWGMRVGETTVLPPRDGGCTIALLTDGGVRIRAWPAVATAGNIRALRQTPPCLLQQGVVHQDLLAGRDKAWAGHTPGIVTRRRSAIGLSEDGRTLLYAIGVECPPKLLATGLLAAGARAAAQLDINWNWTRFLFFGNDANGKPRVAATLAEVQHTARDYVEIASKRDFFYVVQTQP